MNCHLCGSQLKHTVTDLPFKIQNKGIVIIKDLPVWQCEQCPEYLIEDAVMEKIEAIFEHTDVSIELEIVRYAA